MSSRQIRIVVNLLLTVVLAVQPGWAWVSAGRCEVRGAAEFSCDDCGCCQVTGPTQRCGCCGGASTPTITEACCHGEAGSVGVSETAAVAASSQADGGHSRDERLGCGCGVTSQPLGESPTSRPTVVPRELVALRHADLAQPADVTRGGHHSRELLAPDTLSAHFAQIHFCSWRL